MLDELNLEDDRDDGEANNTSAENTNQNETNQDVAPDYLSDEERYPDFEVRHISSYQEAVPGGDVTGTGTRQHPRSPLKDTTQAHERRPFGGTGDNHARIMQELCHRMQDLERRLADRERDQRTPERSHSRSRSRSRSRRTPSPQVESESTGERGCARRRHDPVIYAKREGRRTTNRGDEDARREDDEGRTNTRGPVIIGATPFHHSILEVWLPKHFDKPTDMRYDGT
nr:uncharacterized protein LOC112786397 [Arachis hypogaea]